MDIIIPTNYRLQRLTTTLSSLFLQDLRGDNRLVVIDNSGNDIFCNKQVHKLLLAFSAKGYVVERRYSDLRSISRIKKEAIGFADQSVVALVDNDILFTRHDTLSALEGVLKEYDVACVSPLGFELDNERPVLNEFSHMYDLVEYDENGVGDGSIALGFLLVMNRDDLVKGMRYWCDDLPYMEDQILVHFMKKSRGYAYLRGHTVYHISYDEIPSYEFDESGVVEYLKMKGPEFDDLLGLRMQGKDGAEFSCKIRRKVHA